MNIFSQTKSRHLWPNLISERAEWKGAILSHLWFWVIVLEMMLFQKELLKLLLIILLLFEMSSKDICQELLPRLLIPCWSEIHFDVRLEMLETLQEQFLGFYHDSSVKDEYNAVELDIFSVCFHSVSKTGQQYTESVSAVFNNLFVWGRVLCACQCQNKIPQLSECRVWSEVCSRMDSPWSLGIAKASPKFLLIKSLLAFSF